MTLFGVFLYETNSAVMIYRFHSGLPTSQRGTLRETTIRPLQAQEVPTQAPQYGIPIRIQGAKRTNQARRTENQYRGRANIRKAILRCPLFFTSRHGLNALQRVLKNPLRREPKFFPSQLLIQ